MRRIDRAEAKLGVLIPSKLLYADDIIIFCKATTENILLLRDIFTWYREVLGQFVSPMKSRVFYGQQVAADIRHLLATSLHFVEGSLPFIYLGVPIFLGKPKTLHLQSIADKILGKFDR